MIELRVHHLYNFTKAIISIQYRRRYINDSYSLEQSRAIQSLLQSAVDLEDVKIVLGIDDVCRACPYALPEPNENCEFPDSIWVAKEFMYKVQPNEIVTIGYLKQQYMFYQQVRRMSDWKKRIIESRKSVGGGVN